MEKHLCQSCGMDMVEMNEVYGTNADGSTSGDYCQYCYAKGKFTADISMNQMIDHWIPYLMKEAYMTEEEARKQMEMIIPNLKRWSA